MMQVTVKTLRHYEQKGLLYPCEVDEWTGYRYYSVEQMQRLNTIRQLQSLGFSLDEIKELYEEGAHAPSVEQLSEKIDKMERHSPSATKCWNYAANWAKDWCSKDLPLQCPPPHTHSNSGLPRLG